MAPRDDEFAGARLQGVAHLDEAGILVGVVWVGASVPQRSW